MYIIKIITLGCCLIALPGCSESPVNNDTVYRCAIDGSCSLPERVKENAALIYIIRPYRFLNASEQHYIYLLDGQSGSDRSYVGYLTAGTYCVVYAPGGVVNLMSKGPRNEYILKMRVTNGKRYYVLLDAKTSISSFKLSTTLKEVDDVAGESYLRNDVYNKCRK